MDMKNIGRDNINCICFSTGPLAVGRWPLAVGRWPLAVVVNTA